MNLADTAFRRARRAGLLLLSCVAVCAAAALAGAPPAAPASPAATGSTFPAGSTATAATSTTDSTDARFVPREVRVGGTRHRFAVWLPPGWTAERQWPGLVFLHGSGECGDDGEKPTRVGLGPALAAGPRRWPCVVVFPQKPFEHEEWWEREALVLAALDAARREFRIDPDRVALTGMSQGGHGVWTIGARHPERWSCLAPVCGYGRARTVARRVARLPVWAFHGLRDDVVSPADTRAIVGEIRAERARLGLEPGGETGARMTLYPEANHNSWDSAYSEADLPGWLVAHARERRGDPAR